jgi:hypothetical protein
MLSALILAGRGQPAVPLARQLAHQRSVRPGPLVLGTAPLKPPAPTADRDRHFCYPQRVSAGVQVVSVPPGSPRRHGGRTISSPQSPTSLGTEDGAVFGVWPLRIPNARTLAERPSDIRSFLLIVRTRRIVTAPMERVARDSRSSQHLAEFIDSAERFTVSRRSKPSSRTALTGEQPDPWDLLQPQDATSRHRT